MGKPEIEFRPYVSRDFLGRKRWNVRIVDVLNHKILFSTGRQGYSRLIDAKKAIGLVQRYAAIADIRETEK